MPMINKKDHREITKGIKLFNQENIGTFGGKENLKNPEIFEAGAIKQKEMEEKVTDKLNL